VPAPPGPAALTHDQILAAARKKPSSVYLVVGEPFQTEALARALIDVLVPADRRSFNLETYDGRNAALGPILDSLRTPGFFRGAKVIWVRESVLFLSTEKRGDVSAALFTAWAEDRQSEAAEKLLTLAAMAGWKAAQLETTDFATATATSLGDLLGQTPSAEERAVLAAVRGYCQEHNLSVADFRDDGGLLQEFLERGHAGDAVLLFTASTIDRRKRIVTLIRERGTIVELSFARERSGALAEASIDQLLNGALERAGKRLVPAGRQLLLRRAGGDPAAVAMEIEKLLLYVGEAATIREDDVRVSFRDMGESWIFDFTRALSQRQAGAAVGLLRDLFSQGEHPLRLLALIARELRMLLLARDCLAELKGQWKPGIQFATFKDRLLPLLSDELREGFGNMHPYALYQSLLNASRIRTGQLHRAVLGLHELDLKMKRSLGDPHILLERFVLDLCR
jgi:DNA polymerase-3 subunit delta